MYIQLQMGSENHLNLHVPHVLLQSIQIFFIKDLLKG